MNSNSGANKNTDIELFYLPGERDNTDFDPEVDQEAQEDLTDQLTNVLRIQYS